MKYYLIAGEASGDLHASNLMKELKALDKDAQFRFFGGDLMQAQGGTLVKHYREMAFMGFVEVLMNLRVIFKNLSECKKDILTCGPDVLILVDFPGFNMRMAEFARQQGIKVCYYISPKVWAWNQKRVLKIKKVVDKMLCILPFEVEFYRQWGFEAYYVGNPLMDAMAAHQVNEQFRGINDLDERPVVALLPGSRRQEIINILPDMLRAVTKLDGYQIVIAGAPTFTEDFYNYLTVSYGEKVRIVFDQTYDLLAHASAAVVTSGTATLETALFNVPQVVCYKANPVSVFIARMLVKIRFISLVNLIVDKEVVKELIQEECNGEKIRNELESILHDHAYRSRMLENYAFLREKVGGSGASKRAAQLICNFVIPNNNNV